MMQKNDKIDHESDPKILEKSSKRPNETSGLNIDEHVKIYDPNTREVMLEKRA